MAVITVSGEPGCRTREVAHLTAQRLAYLHLPQSKIDAMLEEEFGPAADLPARAWPQAVSSILLRHATEHHMVVGVDGAERLFENWHGLLRVRIIAPPSRRVGNIMLDHHLDRAAAKAQLKERENATGKMRKARFGRTRPEPHDFDITLNAGGMDGDHMASLIESAVRARALQDVGYLSRAAEAQMQFRLRYQLSRDGIQPRGKSSLNKVSFGHPSEEIFANLLDFYRIDWEYEPRSFPIAWDKNGRVLEAFTPDFYLPESDMYVELTTMKQSLVTKKNRKVKLLRAIYPDVNIQVFYQKDLQDLVFKYGLTATEQAPA